MAVTNTAYSDVITPRGIIVIAVIRSRVLACLLMRATNHSQLVRKKIILIIVQNVSTYVGIGVRLAIVSPNQPKSVAHIIKLTISQ